MSHLPRPSGLLLGTFAQRREDAVNGAAAAGSSHPASRIPVSRQQEGAVENIPEQHLHTQHKFKDWIGINQRDKLNINQMLDNQTYRVY